MIGTISERNVTSRSRKLIRRTNPITIGARSCISWLKSDAPAASPVTWAVHAGDRAEGRRDDVAQLLDGVLGDGVMAGAGDRDDHLERVWSWLSRSVNGGWATPVSSALPKRAMPLRTSGAVTSFEWTTSTAGEGEPGKAFSMAPCP